MVIPSHSPNRRVLAGRYVTVAENVRDYKFLFHVGAPVGGLITTTDHLIS